MGNNLSKQIRDWPIVTTVIGALILLGLIVVWLQSNNNNATAFLWSFASLAFGVLLGFLFGIPRVLQGNNQSEPPTVTQERSASQANIHSVYRLQVNTNLEQISDWLTKIIVGIGLIELRRFPEFMQTLARFVSQGLDNSTLAASAASQVFAMAIIIFFAVVGFLGGYVLTRIYLTGAFSRADVEAQSTVFFGGHELPIEQVSKELNSQIADLREQVIQLSSASASPGGKLGGRNILSYPEAGGEGDFMPPGRT